VPGQFQPAAHHHRACLLSTCQLIGFCNLFKLVMHGLSIDEGRDVFESDLRRSTHSGGWRDLHLWKGRDSNSNRFYLKIQFRPLIAGLSYQVQLATNFCPWRSCSACSATGPCGDWDHEK
jgi:hypothetical protein